MKTYKFTPAIRPAVWFFSLAALTASSHLAAQQLYKSIGADGKVTYSDTPPPRSAKNVTTKILDGPEVATATLPYELAQAVQKNPVTLYTTSACAACDSARSFLSNRGVPFAEKTVTTAEDNVRLKRAGGTNSLPFVLIGRSKQVGFEGAAWATMLSAAGYPEQSKLPRGYRNAAAAAAAPVVVKEIKVSEKVETDASSAVVPKSVNDKAPPGFHF